MTPKTLALGKRTSRLCILVVLLLSLSSLLVTAKCIFAQPPIIGGVKEGVYCSGTADNFNCPEEPATPDAALISMLTAHYGVTPCLAFLDFDEFPGLPDCIGTPIPLYASFIHQLTFAVPAGGITSATLKFRAKATPFGQTDHDFIAFFEGSTYITGANLKLLPEASGTWNHNQDETFSLDLSNLQSGFSTNSILQYLNDGDLDVVIGDFTGVDWMCLYVPTDDCLGNIIQNWSFIDGAVAGPMPSPGQTGNWTLAYGSPDVHVGDACGDSASVTMWGNKVVGEAIQQTLTFVKDRCYSIKFCARWAHLPGRPYPVQFEFRASNVPLTETGVPPGAALIGISPPVITEQEWTSMPLIKWKATDDYSILTVSATNGRIDRICIHEYINGDVNADSVINLGDVVYLISYLYKGGPEPSPVEAGDCNCDGIVDVGDIVYLVSYLYKGGPPPGC